MDKLDTDQINRILKWIADSAEGGTDWVLAQAPEVVQQLILWKRVECTIYMVVGLAIILVFPMTWRKTRRLAHEARKLTSNEGDLWDPSTPAAVVILTRLGTGVLAIIGAGVAASNGALLLELLLAPKVYVLEYARSLLGS